MDYKTAIVVLGPQGAGKGTQAKILSRRIKAPIIEAGELLRQEKSKRSAVGQTIAKYQDKGLLVPDKTLVEVISRAIHDTKESNTYIFDGLPRNAHQKEIFDSMLENLHFNQLIVVYIKLPDNEGVERLLKRGRHDDVPELIKKRLSIYHKDTEPVIKSYHKNGHLLEINGSPPVKLVAKEIEDKIKDLI